MNNPTVQAMQEKMEAAANAPALFVNFTGESFTHTWNGKAYTFKAGESMNLPLFLAKHMAKHLANRELAKLGDAGARSQSPKKLEQDALFMGFYNKALVQAGTATDPVAAQIELMNKQKSQNVSSDIPPQMPATPAAAPETTPAPQPEVNVQMPAEQDPDTEGFNQ